MVATMVLVVSNKPIQSSMNNISSDSKVMDESGRHLASMADESMAHAMHGMQVRKY